MPTFKIKSPDGRVVTLRGETPPSESDLDSIFSSLPPKPRFREDIPRILGRQVIPGARGGEISPLTEGPFGLGLNLAGIRETKPSIPEPETRLGKGIETSADIAQLALLGWAGIKGIGSLARKAGQARKLTKLGGPQGALKKAEELTVKVLQPGQKRLSQFEERLEDFPAAREASKVIKKSKTFRDVVKNIREGITSLERERDFRLERGSRIHPPSYIKSLANLIRKKKLDKQFPISEQKQMLGVLREELEWFNQNKGGLTTKKLLERKRFLQDKSESLIIAREGGKNISNAPARSAALDELRFAAKKELQTVDPNIETLDESVRRLIEAQKLAAIQSTKIRKEIPKSMIAEIFDRTFGRLTQRGGTVGVSMQDILGSPEKKLSSITKEIEELRRLAGPEGITRLQPAPPLPKRLTAPISRGTELPSPVTPKQIEGPIRPRALGVTSREGHGFIRPSPSESDIALARQFGERLEVPFVGPRKRPAFGGKLGDLASALIAGLRRRGLE